MSKKRSPKKNAAAQALGRLGGSQNTPAQIQAKRRNAELAGRPGRICADCGQPVHGWHKNRALDFRCQGRTWRWQSQNEKRELKAVKKAKAG